MIHVMRMPARRGGAVAIAASLLLTPSLGAAQGAGQGGGGTAREDARGHLAGSPPEGIASEREPLTLVVAVDAALEAHPSLEAARARRSGAGAAVGVANAARLPRLSLDGSASRFQEPMPIAPIHGFDPQRLPVFDRTLYQGALSLSYTLFDGGERRARAEGARARADAAEAAVDAARLTLLAEVARAYLSVRTTRELVAAHDARLAALEQERDRVGQFFAEGRTARVAGLRADAAIGRANAERAAAVAALDVAERSLARSMGRMADAVRGRPLATVRLAASAAEPDRAALVARATSSNPDVTRARGRVRAADAEMAAARAAWFPDVGFVGGYTQYAGGTGDRQGEWRGGLRVSVPLFTGGARTGEARRAGAASAAARAELRAAELSVADAADRAAAELVGARARAEALAAVVELAAEVARIERLALDNGAGVQTDYLAAEAELLRARAGLAEARNAVVGARIELARVTGELSRDWLATNLESGS